MRRKFESVLAQERVAKDFEWQKWAIEIPTLKFREHWDVRIIPPLTGAMIRFRVSSAAMREKRGPNASISVYLDCYDNLGCMNQPYWEIYPVEDDTRRYLLNETTQLTEGIAYAMGETVTDPEKT